ncbi:molybdopterin-guanine dinucleotide biosynthesis protein B [Escherichia coli]|nr:molybdopterin-guanine dinucleotide biosynthesis protein B [Escherichia coli]
MAGKTMIPLLAFAAWSGTGKNYAFETTDPGIMRQRDPSRAD